RPRPPQGRRRGDGRAGARGRAGLHRGRARRALPPPRPGRRGRAPHRHRAVRRRIRRVVRHGAGRRADRGATRRGGTGGERQEQHVLPGGSGMSVPEIITMGRVGVDVYPLQVGVSLREVETFGKYLGGSPTNVAVAAARLGRRAAVITRTGADPFGDFIHDALRSYGVDDRWVTAVPGLPTPVTFCEIRPPEDFPLYFYRWPKAPDLEIRPEELDTAAIRDADLFWATVTGLSQEPSRAAHEAAWRARGRRHPTVLDLDYRPMFWESREAAQERVLAALAHVTVAVGNLDEVEVATGVRDPYAAAKALLDAGVRLAVVKQGSGGVLGMTADEVVEVPRSPA